MLVLCHALDGSTNVDRLLNTGAGRNWNDSKDGIYVNAILGLTGKHGDLGSRHLKKLTHNTTRGGFMASPGV